MRESNRPQSSSNQNNNDITNSIYIKNKHLGVDELSELYKQCYKSASGIPIQKYKKGSNVWSGRGRMPVWVREHLDLGGTLDDMLTPVALYHKMMKLKASE
ncbi:H-NS family nucleoid-associated regulatory protein [Leucothrix arctica]|uniref:DNA-binding protein H-NS-like C-terminal domain-containing protein n=1 Tax=Leucothrix arctica TaxID=1481894 RepID=A0A317CBK9_9GAMM|nr:H-NS family nucleoid-associated regulatory protein [Leucothrix arctica]PWQ93740.1 hypothetical protein DKT75_19210 [Leucothrix arctica]